MSIDSRQVFSRRTAIAAPVLLLPFVHRAAIAQEAAAPTRKLDVPYVPTNMDTVHKMLEMANVRKNDVVFDLGCGDGRIVVTAAKEHGARGVGIDLNPERIAEANENARKAGVTQRVQFKVGNLFESDFAPATVVTLYLLPDVNAKLRPQLWRQLKVGTRVVSHAFDMPGVKPDKVIEVTSNQDDITRKLYLWTTPLKKEPKKE